MALRNLWISRHFNLIDFSLAENVLYMTIVQLKISSIASGLLTSPFLLPHEGLDLINFVLEVGIIGVVIDELGHVLEPPA